MSNLRAYWILFFVCGGLFSHAEITSEKIDATVAKVLQKFAVPGLVVGVINNGEVVHRKAYGIREVGLPDPVDTQTLFKIASNTKAFTSAALAMLVDEGKMNWDDKVVDHLPEFRLSDPWVTREFTIIDLLTHRSGLGLGAGDLMLWPEPNHYSRSDIVHALRYLQPTTSFRTQYAYDNLLYIVAGEVVAAVSGMSWEKFIDQRLLKRIGAQRCFAGTVPMNQMNNLAAPHGVVEGQLTIIERSRILSDSTVSAAAGGIRCSLDDMLLWVLVQISEGKIANGRPLFSAEQSRIMWTPVTLRQVSEQDLERDKTHFKAYGLGWRLADVHGFKQVAHTGTLAGSTSMVTLIPELEVGVVVLTNGSAGAVRLAITNTIIRDFMGVAETDWVTLLAEPSHSSELETPNNTEELHLGGRVQHNLAAYTGRFKDPWFGEIEVFFKSSDLWFAAKKSPRLQGKLWPLKGNSFVARWEDRTIQGDAIVRFLDKRDTGFSEIKMLPISEDIDFSFDYQDLVLKRVQD